MRVLAGIGMLAVLAGIGGAVYFFGGFYSVAAIEPDSPWVAWALQSVRQASIGRHAGDQPPFSLDDTAAIAAGARAFGRRGCPACHGAPGVQWEKFSEGMQPDPPDLKEVAAQAPAHQIFWVIKNGINMTAMPSFGSIGAADDEIWRIVAFVKKLPSISEADYKSWTSEPPANAPAPTPPATSPPP